MVFQVSQKLGVSEIRACKVLEQAMATQRRGLSPPSDEKQLTDDIIALAVRYGKYGYRRITSLLNNEYGWRLNHKRVERIWRKEGLKVPKKQPKRSRLWFNDVSCILLRPEHKDHVWSYDFMIDRTVGGRIFHSGLSKVPQLVQLNPSLIILVPRKVQFGCFKVSKRPNYVIINA